MSLFDLDLTAMRRAHKAALEEAMKTDLWARLEAAWLNPSMRSPNDRRRWAAERKAKMLDQKFMRLVATIERRNLVET